MDHFAGLDISVKDMSVCIVDDMGKIAREVKVPSEPDALLAVLKNPAYHYWAGPGSAGNDEPDVVQGSRRQGADHRARARATGTSWYRAVRSEFTSCRDTQRRQGRYSTPHLCQSTG